MKDLKYLVGYVLPVCSIVALYLQGAWSFLTPIVAFILIPIAERLFPQNTQNLSPDEIKTKEKNPFFDFLLYLNIPLVFSMVGYFLWSLTFRDYSGLELSGLTFSVGLALGSNGINVAHELGHRTTKWERTLGKLLFLPSLYMHFYIEHNYGHHLHVATPEDPASAKYNQSVYSFWISSIVGQYRKAWRIQKDLLKRSGKSFFSIQNDMFYYTLFESAYLVGIYVWLGIFGLLIALLIAVISVLLLETINYIEHYGLRRNKTPSGRYERASEIHSWNSNHVLGRMMLYELTRHSDHHHRAHKKYQLLEYHEVSPQLPYGYPSSMVISMIPSLWFALMNPRIPSEMKR